MIKIEEVITSIEDYMKERIQMLNEALNTDNIERQEKLQKDIERAQKALNAFNE